MNHRSQCQPTTNISHHLPLPLPSSSSMSLIVMSFLILHLSPCTCLCNVDPPLPSVQGNASFVLHILANEVIPSEHTSEGG
ncbi:hypothetical protein PISMIDRAFT_570103 [Pisolithus microcarpus 441]|uniref:Uncharacterized protein n=1 Tax=Pisolithus microcarpus 441 TaxID=765257 RepID=A0A0C9YKC5_9AGAM|nr:hypothetical protein BKA83DRAFT_570103 [Pisolithus microcarpus]KIK10812.1 hypothetical protein PISMIDRAFT_570103 [Pisolithus microcarpus 441]